MRLAYALFAALVVLTAGAQPVAAQRNLSQQLREAQSRLNNLRQARDSLEQDLNTLRSQARNINAEISNLTQQRRSTARLVNELDRQLMTLRAQVDTMTVELIVAQDALAEKQAILERRAVAIYKRGTLWAFEVLLAAESFGDLLSRYKYLFIAGQQDRSLVRDIETLRDRLAVSRRDLVAAQEQLARQRNERGTELSRYANLERQRQRTLSATIRREEQASSQLESIAEDEASLMQLIVSLERSPVSAFGAPSISGEDLGRLDWPVEGQVIYRFGNQPFRDGTFITRAGIGIRAPAGTPVTAVRGGLVVRAESRGTYGNMVILEHGGGYYTVYTQLSAFTVQRGNTVIAGQTIGRTGGDNTDEGPHLGFQMYQTPRGSDAPIALDPLNWLVPQRSRR